MSTPCFARGILTGVTVNMNWKTYNGFTLFTPLGRGTVNLIDMRGRIAHTWEMLHSPALYGELLPSGSLLYLAHIDNGPLCEFEGSGGKLLEVDWNGDLMWRHEDPYLHHAFCRMPTGNTIVLRWVEIPSAIARRVKGGVPGTEKNGVMFGDSLQEINLEGQVVWEWLSYEHLDPQMYSICPLCSREQWTQANSCATLSNGDILVSFRRINTVCVISRATGRVEWRWGPDEISHQNSVTPLANGNILLFDNGIHANGDHYPFSRVLEVNMANKKMMWEYRDKANANVNFYSGFMSSCQRLPNGNTLICEAKTGRIFEVRHEGEIVWEFVNPSFGYDPMYGNNNVVSRAIRYRADYEGLKGQAVTLPEFGQMIEKTEQTDRKTEMQVKSRLEQLGY